MKKVYKEFFLHTEIAILIVLTICLIGASSLRGITIAHGVFFAAGLVVFMFSEYLTHRFVFHLKAPKHPILLKLLKRLHYDHHVHPNDLHLLFLPIWYSLPSMIALSAIFFGLNQEWFHTLSFSAGLLSMLVIYEWTHYVAHTPIKPKTKFGKWLKKVHILHHYKNENFWFGVSTPFVDVLFGTLKDEKEVEMSGTARDLEKKSV